jgi:hypothetical protein
MKKITNFFDKSKSTNSHIINVFMNDPETNSVTKLYYLTDAQFNNMSFTCDLYNVLRRGKHQKVIELSLYGRNLFYYQKLKSLTLTVKHLFPEWSFRIYYDRFSINEFLKLNAFKTQ